jgi:hypothetical protein
MMPEEFLALPVVPGKAYPQKEVSHGPYSKWAGPVIREAIEEAMRKGVDYREWERTFWYEGGWKAAGLSRGMEK